jgi:hypothetical protein
MKSADLAVGHQQEAACRAVCRTWLGSSDGRGTDPIGSSHNQNAASRHLLRMILVYNEISIVVAEGSHV